MSLYKILLVTMAASMARLLLGLNNLHHEQIRPAMAEDLTRKKCDLLWPLLLHYQFVNYCY